MKGVLVRKAAGVVLLATLFGLLFVVPAAWARQVNVNIRNLEFEDGNDDTVFINPDDRVKWTHRDGQTPHTVTANDDSFDSSDSNSCSSPLLDDCLREGETFEHTFESLGTFTYFCKQHTNMTGTVRVVPKGSRQTTPPPTTSGPGPTATKTSASPTATGTATGTGTGTISPTVTGSATLSEPPRANPPDDGSGNSRIAIAAAGVLLLSVAGFLVYRRFISSP